MSERSIKFRKTGYIIGKDGQPEAVIVGVGAQDEEGHQVGRQVLENVFGEENVVPLVEPKGSSTFIGAGDGNMNAQRGKHTKRIKTKGGDWMDIDLN
jgi:hypothetical protein